MSLDDAQLAARKAFGGVDQAKMRYRDQRGLPILDALTQDARFAVRVLARDRGFALTAILRHHRDPGRVRERGEPDDGPRDPSRP